MVGKKYDMLIQKNISINLYTIKTNLYTRLYTIKILLFLFSSSLFEKLVYFLLNLSINRYSFLTT